MTTDTSNGARSVDVTRRGRARRRGEGGITVGAALYVLLVAVHALFSVPMRQPALFADELGYLGNARYLAGVAPMPDMGTTTFYHFGYSLLLLPAFWLSEDPELSYRLVMLINAMLTSLVFPALYYTLHAGFGAPRRLSVFVALVTSLYPAFVLHGVFAWAENALIPGYALLIAAVAAMLTRYALWKVLLVCALTAFLYTIHPRALPLIPAVALCLAALATTRMAPWSAVAAGVATIGLIYAGTVLASDHLRTLGWSPERGPRSVARIVSRPLSLSGAANMTISMAGQVLYLAQATCGVALVAPFYFLGRAWREGPRAILSRYGARRVWLAAVVVISSSSLFAASAFVLWAGGRRADHVIYGRYNEAFLAIYLAGGLLLLCGRARRPGRLTLLVSAAVAALTTLVLAARGELLARALVPTNVIGIYPVVLVMGRIDLIATSAASVALFLIVIALCRHTVSGGLIAMSLVFVGATAYTYCLAYLPARHALAEANVLAPYIRSIATRPHVSLDTAALERTPNRYYSYQYLLPHATIDRFKSTDGESPPTPVVVSHRYWPGAEESAARLVASEPRTDLALWLLPSARHYLSATQSYIGVALGWRRFPGVWESGFHRRERGARFRWTDGRARLVVPVNEFPRRLAVDLRPATPGMRVQVLVNDTLLFDGPYQGGARTLDLTPCPVTDWIIVELRSQTVLASQRSAATGDDRAIGIAVREIRLLPQ